VFGFITGIFKNAAIKYTKIPINDNSKYWWNRSAVQKTLSNAMYLAFVKSLCDLSRI